MRECYYQCIVMMRKLYHECKLVHADLSEYNILYHKGSIYIIDVSQSVEHDHPHAMEFLRSDCTNITEFFKKNKVGVMKTRDLFDFITDVSITDSNMEEYLEKIQEKINKQGEENDEQFEEQVFKNTFIPTSLDQIDHEKEALKVKKRSTK